MPGFLLHLAYAKKVCEMAPNLIPEEDYKLFLAGNLLPDLAETKAQSHFQVLSPNGWFIPDLIQAEKSLMPLLEKHNSVALGALCHLAYDRLFFLDYLGENYLLQNNVVYEVHGQRRWPIEDFLSKDGLYGTYSYCNLQLIRDGLVPIYELWSLPELPPLGNPAFDVRNNRNIKKEMISFLSDPIFCPKDLIFSYSDIKNSIYLGISSFINLANSLGLG